MVIYDRCWAFKKNIESTMTSMLSSARSKPARRLMQTGRGQMTEHDLRSRAGLGTDGNCGAVSGDTATGTPDDALTHTDQQRASNSQLSREEQIRAFGDEFRRNMQAAIDRDGPEVFWKKVYDYMKKAMGDEW